MPLLFDAQSKNLLQGDGSAVPDSKVEGGPYWSLMFEVGTSAFTMRCKTAPYLLLRSCQLYMLDGLMAPHSEKCLQHW